MGLQDLRPGPEIGKTGPAQPQAGLKPGPDQEQIGRAGAKQRQGERQEHVLAGGFEAGRHGEKHPLIPADESRGFFFRGFRTRLRLTARCCLLQWITDP